MSKKDYPKMLYQGNLQVFKTAIAENEDHESELKEQGWIEYGDLKEPKTESKGVAHSVGASALEGLDDIKQELAGVTQERDELRTENERLSDIITRGSVENVELKENLSKSDSAYDKFRNDVAAMKARIAELQGDDTPTGTTHESEQKLVALNDLTLPQLQEMAKSKGVEFKVRDSKDTLIKLLMKHQDLSMSS